MNNNNVNNNLIISLLTLLLIILLGDLYLLNTQITTLLNLIHDQSIKIQELENLIKKESVVSSDANTTLKVITGVVAFIGIIVVLVYFGGVDMDLITTNINTTANQVVELINKKNSLDGSNIETVWIHERKIAEESLNYLNSKFDLMESKLSTILNNIYTMASSHDYNKLINNYDKTSTIIKSTTIK